MPRVDFWLFGPPIWNVARTMSCVRSTRTRGLDNADSLVVERREELPSRFRLIEAVLAVTSKVPQHFIAEDGNLSGLSDHIQHKEHAGQSSRRTQQGLSTSELGA